MSAVIVEAKPEGQMLPFSHTTPTRYNLIKIQTHSTAGPVQVVLTVRQLSSLYPRAGTPPTSLRLPPHARAEQAKVRVMCLSSDL